MLALRERREIWMTIMAGRTLCSARNSDQGSVFVTLAPSPTGDRRSSSRWGEIDRLRAVVSQTADPDRPAWMTAMALFCALTVMFLAWRDGFVPEVGNAEVWLGFELHGAAARLSAPLHWAIFATGAWGFWRAAPWITPAAAAYASYVSVSHLVWNVTSPSGGGWRAGFVQAALFSLPAIALWRAHRRGPVSGT
jgi:hypothetical protein